jgi:hypothetical protein
MSEDHTHESMEEPAQDESAPGEEAAVDEETMASRRFDAWRRRSAIGAMASGVALGLQDIFYPTKNEPVITAEAPGDPPDADERIRVILDPDDPTNSVAIMPTVGPAEPPADPQPDSPA